MSIEREVYLSALEISDPEKRAAFLDAACPNQEFRARVERMLEFDQDDSFLAESEIRSHQNEFGQAETTASFDPSALVGTTIDQYSLRDVVGEGGFGIVYKADQLEPVQRTVALKIIKLGMDTRQVVARFEAERQTLAMMDHPNIAKVLAGGASESGRPYFVMEYVDGLPITKYCDRHQLDLRERLELMATVSRAVQHAHQRGIIHRDIKPSNVIVGHQDGRSTPKIIDFGIAKAIQQREAERTAFTQANQIIGTPAYMSPEQAGKAEFDVDTRSDVYSLGVLLYELLTGTTPLQDETAKAAAFDEICRLIREERFPPPSTRLSDLGNALKSIAADRKTPSAQLRVDTKGELDWIVMKAIEKERSRRYESALDFATDIEAYLRNEPIQAAPPSLAYRWRKFLAKNWKSVAVAASLAGLLLLGSILSTIGFVTASREVKRNRELLYAGDVMLSNVALETGNIEQAEAYLQNHADSELKSFPWEYMSRQLRLFDAKMNSETPTHDVVYSEEGDYLISVGELGKVHVWNTDDYSSHRKWNCKMACAMSATVRGDMLVIGGRIAKDLDSQGSIQLWNWKTGERIETLELDENMTCIIEVEFIPNSNSLVIASMSDVFAYDIESKSERWILAPADIARGTSAFRALAVSADGKLVATAEPNGNLLVVNAETGENVLPKVTIPRVRCLSFSNDGQYLAFGQIAPITSQPLSLINLKTQEVTQLATNFAVESVRFSPDDKTLASFNWRGQVIFWETSSKRAIGEVPAHANAPGALAFSPDGHSLATCGQDRSVKVWNVQEQIAPALAPTGQVAEVVSWYTFSNDSRSVISSARGLNPKRWDVQSGRLIQEYVLPEAGHRFAPRTAFSSDDQLVAAIDLTDHAIVWNADTGERLHLLETPDVGGPRYVEFRSAPRRLVVGGVGRKRDRLTFTQREWNLETGMISVDETVPINLPMEFDAKNVAGYPHYRVRAGGDSDRFRMSPDNRLIALGIGSDVFLIAASSGKTLHRFEQLEHVVIPVTFSPDGKYLAAAGQSQTIMVWDTETGQLTNSFEAPTWPGVLNFSPDGTTLAAGYYDGSIGFWDLRVETEILHIEAHTFPVTTLQFSNDGQTLASGGWDGGIKIWQTNPER